MSTGRIPLTRLYERTSARGNRYLYGCLGYARVLGFPRETAAGGIVWELFVVEAPAPSPSARRDGADGPKEGEEGQAVAAVSPSPHPAPQRRRPAARTPAGAPEAEAADEGGFDWDRGDDLPF
jgi:hypothetical protein